MFAVPKFTNNCIRLYERQTNMDSYGGRSEKEKYSMADTS